jgi:hypothetical protein
MNNAPFFNPQYGLSGYPTASPFMGTPVFSSTVGINSYYGTQHEDRARTTISQLLDTLAMLLVSQLTATDNAFAPDWNPNGFDSHQDGWLAPPPVLPTTPNRADARGLSLTRELKTKFDQIDQNKDTIVTDDELLAGKKTGTVKGNLENLLYHSSELMFAHIDSGDAAWFGLSKTDLNVLEQKLKADRWAKLDDVATDIRKGSWLGQKLGADATHNQFINAVEEQRKTKTHPTLP